MLSPDPNLFKPYRGDQWTELDSSCAANGVDSTGGNIALYQDLTLTPGNLYQFSFSYKGKPFVNSLQRLSVKFGDETVFLNDITQGDWVTFKFVRKATQATMRLEFEELGKDDSRGTFLDDVRVFDLGVKKN